MNLILEACMFIETLGNLISAVTKFVILFIPHYKTEYGDVLIDDETKSGKISGLRFFGYIIYREIEIFEDLD